MATYDTAWKRVRLRVLHEEKFVCRLCGDYANQVDHIIALADGGPRLDRRNLQAACRRCNVAKENQRRLDRMSGARAPAEVRPW